MRETHKTKTLPSRIQKHDERIVWSIALCTCCSCRSGGVPVAGERSFFVTALFHTESKLPPDQPLKGDKEQYRSSSPTKTKARRRNQSPTNNSSGDNPPSSFYPYQRLSPAAAALVKTISASLRFGGDTSSTEVSFNATVAPHVGCNAAAGIPQAVHHRRPEATHRPQLCNLRREWTDVQCRASYATHAFDQDTGANSKSA